MWCVCMWGVCVCIVCMYVFVCVYVGCVFICGYVDYVVCVWCSVYAYGVCVCVCVVFVCLCVYQHVLSSLLASLVKGSLYVTVPQPKSHHTALKSREWLLETL